MREFRGNRVDNKKWAKGYYAIIDTGNRDMRHFIITTKAKLGVEYYQSQVHRGFPRLEGSFEVIPETVGQSTGKTERWRQDRLVWEGDIVKFRFEYGFIGNLQQKTVRAVVVYNT
ncbi:MAG TPA: hypothetical protein ENH82_09660, partial [bacterium]|nr:hypothetical protein [bacterium]